MWLGDEDGRARSARSARAQVRTARRRIGVVSVGRQSRPSSARWERAKLTVAASLSNVGGAACRGMVDQQRSRHARRWHTGGADLREREARPGGAARLRVLARAAALAGLVAAAHIKLLREALFHQVIDRGVERVQAPKLLALELSERRINTRNP
ncbi:MAG: hypothetical protein ABIY55_26170 [Kofleriaceae bacterium]